MKRRILSSVFLATVLMASGCGSIGPRTINHDRIDYSDAVGDSWKAQMLLNVVKLRYMDLPIFVDVAQIVSGYTLQTQVTVGGTVSSEKAIQGNFFNAAGAAQYTDRPTITYSPLTGDKFLRALMTPIEPKAVFSMLESGYAADFVLGMTLESLNGVNNRSVAAGALREADPRFVKALQLLREIQTSGAFGVRVEQSPDKLQDVVFFFRGEGEVPPEIDAKTRQIRELLHLEANDRRYKLVYSPARGSKGELGVGTRSVLQIMQAMASFVDVPAEDIKERRAIPSLEHDAGNPGAIRIHSGPKRPTDAFAVITYQGRWFWVDDRDWRTKRALSVVMLLFTLANTGGAESLPVITIPAS
ncbi:MAG TPA: hypothetical protein VGI81_06325 [Tepidisphaeraceae bacterium]|jgi:uncharacterized protein YceK